MLDLDRRAGFQHLVEDAVDIPAQLRGFEPHVDILFAVRTSVSTTDEDHCRALAADAGREGSRAAEMLFAFDRRPGEQGPGGGGGARFDDVELGRPQEEEEIEIRRVAPVRAWEEGDVGVAAPYPGGDRRGFGGGAREPGGGSAGACARGPQLAP